VGCAFAVCLERKQKRDKECSVTMNFDTSNSTFTRTGSFRQAPLTERIHDPQDCKPPAGNPGAPIERVSILDNSSLLPSPGMGSFVRIPVAILSAGFLNIAAVGVC